MKNLVEKLGKGFKNVALKSGSALVAVAMAVIIADVNSTCAYFINQPELPENWKSLRK